MEKLKAVKLEALHLCGIVLIAGAVFIALSMHKPISDFGNYYYGSRLAVQGKGVDALYDVMAFNRYVEQQGEQNFFLSFTTVSPQTVLLWQPFSWIPGAQTAKIIFNISGLLLFVFSLHRFMRKYSLTIGWKELALTLAALVPVYYNMLFGQTYLIVAALIMESVLSADKRNWLSGLLLAVVIALKVSPAILLIWFLAQRKFRVVVWTVVCWLLITWVNAILFDGMGAATRHFYVETLPRMMNGFVTDPYSSSYQGFIVFLRKLCVPDAILNPHALIAGTERVVQLINSLFFILIAFLLTGAWKSTLDVRKKILLLLLVVNITSGYNSTYSMLLLLPFISFGTGQRDAVRLLLYGVVFAFPPRIFDGYTAFAEEYKLWIFIALFLLEIRPSLSYSRIEKPQLIVGAMLLIMIVFRLGQRPEVLPLKYYHPETVQQDYVLDAFVNDGEIGYLSFSADGFKEYNLKTAESWSTGNADLQYVHGVTIRTVGYCNGNYLVLSDYHRGPGLFHLYTITGQELNMLKQQ